MLTKRTNSVWLPQVDRNAGEAYQQCMAAHLAK
jgi:hypothetical protein